MRLREVVWIAVATFVMAVATPIVAILMPESLTLVVGLGLSSVALALLSQRV